MSAKDTQVGGSHYSDRAIQPVDYAMANEFNYIQSLVLRYLTRYPYKGVPVDDLRKIKHLCDLEIERLLAECESDAKGVGI